MEKTAPGQDDGATDQQKALQNALGQVEKIFGRGSVMRMNAADREPIEAIPTGSLTLDMA
ncbi:MAG: DNA recombination/repair protein RecA, partial [Armatimonadota bacterium]